MAEVQLAKEVLVSQVSGDNAVQAIEAVRLEIKEVVTTEVSDGLLGEDLEVNNFISEPVAQTSAGIKLILVYTYFLKGVGRISSNN